MKHFRFRLLRNFFSSLSVTNQLIIINFFVFISLFISLFFFKSSDILQIVALTPSLIISQGAFWTLLTSMFTHFSAVHLFANMFSLFFLGNFLETIIGRKRFFFVYLVSGFLGGIFFVAAAYLFGNPIQSAVGASGAIFGLLGVLACLVPYSKISLIVGPLALLILDVVITPQIPSSFASFFSVSVNILIFLMILSLFSSSQTLRKLSLPLELPMWLVPFVAIIPLVIIDYYFPLPIGNSAHLGGLVLGLFYGFYLRFSFPQKTKLLREKFR